MSTPARINPRSPPLGDGNSTVRTFGAFNQPVAVAPQQASTPQGSLDVSPVPSMITCSSLGPQHMPTPSTADPVSKRKREDDDEEARERSVKRLSYDYNNVIYVLVGPQEEASVVHENFIGAKSKFFAAACRKEWLDGVRKLVRLPEVESSIFKSYLNWIYTGHLAVKDTVKSESEPSAGAEHAVEHAAFLKLYLLGYKLDDVSLRNQAMTLMVKHRFQPVPSMVKLAFDNTPQNSLLRVKLISSAAKHWSRTTFAKRIADYSSEFVHAIAILLMRQTKISPFADFLEMLPGLLEDEPET